MAIEYEALPTSESTIVLDEEVQPARSRLRSFFSRFSILLPLYFHPEPSSSSNNGPGRRLRKTAYLDGLRGFAAFVVYWQHHHVGAHIFSPLEFGFGFEGRYYFAAFPFVRTFFNGGSFAVAIFYVISGYVLSTKPMDLLHAGRWDKIEANLASAFARRWARLFIPVAATTFLFFTICHAFAIWQPLFEQKETYFAEVANWYNMLRNFSFIFGPGFLLFPYNPHLWSIPVEFRGSIAVWTTLVAVSRFRRNVRLLATCGLLFYFLVVVDGWYCANFVGGMLLSDLDHMVEADDLPRWIARLEPKRCRQLAWTLVVLVAVYLGNAPTSGDLVDTPGWSLLSYLKPYASSEEWFFLFFASMIVVAASMRTNWLRRFLETRFCQYLGRISYCLYLVHGPILWTLGDRVFAAVGMLGNMRQEKLPGWSEKVVITRWGIYGMEVAYLVAELLLLPFTLYVAELCTTMIDEATVRFLQTIYTKGLPEEENEK